MKNINFSEQKPGYQSILTLRKNSLKNQVQQILTLDSMKNTAMNREHKKSSNFHILKSRSVEKYSYLIKLQLRIHELFSLHSP